MSHDGDVTRVYPDPPAAAAPDASAPSAGQAPPPPSGPKHGFGLAESAVVEPTAVPTAAGMTPTNIVTQPSPEADAPVALAAALAVRQAALDGRPLDGGVQSTNNDTANAGAGASSAKDLAVAGSPAAQPKVCFSSSMIPASLHHWIHTNMLCVT